MVKIWRGKFWGDAKPTELKSRKRSRRPLLGTAATLAIITICIGVFAEPISTFAKSSTEGMKNPTNYIEAVNTPNR